MHSRASESRLGQRAFRENQPGNPSSRPSMCIRPDATYSAKECKRDRRIRASSNLRSRHIQNHCIPSILVSRRVVRPVAGLKAPFRGSWVAWEAWSSGFGRRPGWVPRNPRSTDARHQPCSSSRESIPDPRRDCPLPHGPADVLDPATSRIAIGSKSGVDATRKLPGEGFERPWPPLIRMDPAVKRAVDRLLGTGA